MKEILEKILALPDLLTTSTSLFSRLFYQSLSQEEFNEVVTILKYIIADEHPLDKEHPKYSDLFQTQLKQEKTEGTVKIMPKHIPLIMAYLDQWQEMGMMLLKWNQNTKSIWNGTYPNDIYAAEHMLPIVIRLLPEDRNQLGIIKNKLDSATAVHQSSDFSYIMLVLHSAVCTKIKELEKAMRYDDDEKIVAVAKILCLPEKKKEQEKQDEISIQISMKINEPIDKLYVQLEIEYKKIKKYLAEMIAEAIKKKHPSVYEHYYLDIHNSSEKQGAAGEISAIVFGEKEDDQEEKTYPLKNDTEIFSLLNCYQIIKGILSELKTEKLETLFAQLDLLNRIFAAYQKCSSNNTTNKQAGSGHYYLAWRKTSEQKFTETISRINEQLNHIKDLIDPKPTERKTA